MKPTSFALYAAIACASSLLYPGQAGAQDKMPSPLGQLSGFLGDGTCTGNLLAAKSPRATSAKYHSEKTLGDHWIVVRYDEGVTPSNSRPYHLAQYLGYDAKAGHFVDVLLDNSGGSYAAGTSSGWRGDVLTFENTDFTSGTHPLFRDVFTRRGGLVVSHTGYERDKNGKWTKTDHEICKRM
jgi:hypothetical protein